MVGREGSHVWWGGKVAMCGGRGRILVMSDGEGS